MASKHLVVGDIDDGIPLSYIFIEDKQKRIFKLIIDTRLPHLDTKTPEEYWPNKLELQAIESATIANWALAMRAYLFNYQISEKEDIRAIAKPSVRQGQLASYWSDGDPYVTVWNYALSNAPKISMSSQSLPSDAVMLAKVHIAALQNWNQYCHRFGMYRVGDNPPKQSTQTPNPPTPSNVTPIDTTLTSNSPTFPAIAKSNIRKSRWLEGVQSHLRLQEFVQGGGEKYDKTVLIAIQPFNRTAIQYKHKQKVAFKVLNAISVIENDYQGQKSLQIVIPITGRSVYIKIEPNNDKAYDWKTLRDSLGLQKEQVKELAVGQRLFLGDVYLVLQCRSLDKQDNQLMNKNGQAVQYKSFYGLYYSPEE